MKRLLLTTLLFSQLVSFAQEGERIVIVERENHSKARHRDPKPELDINNYNVFKFDPLRMAIGEINFSWETRIDDHLTLEIEAGPTISNLGANRFYVSPGTGTGMDYTENSGMGVLLSAALRYYPLEDYKAMNKLYVSPRIKYRRYTDNYTSTTPGVSDERAGSDEFIFSFNVGFQGWVSHNFAFDYYIGAGIGSFSGNRYYLASTYDGNSNTWSYDWKEEKANYARFVGVIGMKVCIGN